MLLLCLVLVILQASDLTSLLIPWGNTLINFGTLSVVLSLHFRVKALEADVHRIRRYLAAEDLSDKAGKSGLPFTRPFL